MIISGWSQRKFENSLWNSSFEFCSGFNRRYSGVVLLGCLRRIDQCSTSNNIHDHSSPEKLPFKVFSSMAFSRFKFRSRTTEMVTRFFYDMIVNTIPSTWFSLFWCRKWELCMTMNDDFDIITGTWLLLLYSQSRTKRSPQGHTVFIASYIFSQTSSLLSDFLKMYTKIYGCQNIS